MKVLVVNCGSSSIKYQLIDMENENLMAKGYLEKIGLPDSFLTHTVNGEKHKIEQVIENHEEGIKLVLSQLTHPEYGVIKSFDEIGAIGHRLAHGGDKISEPTLIDENVINVLKEFTPLAPLHNPAEIVGVEACKKVLPDVPMVGVFDTAFHQTLPEKAYIYAIPYEYYEKYGIRKYGFHGTSHRFVSKRVAEVMNKPIEDLKIITCHLGQGASLCAVDAGKSVDTSMGLRHGPKSFLDKKTIVFDFVSNNSYTRKYDLDILDEIKADEIVPLVMGVGQLKKGQDFDGKFFAFSGKELPDAYLALPDIMFGQTIALLTSVKVGNTPDTPSPTGTVNRVVKGVTIHKFIK